MSTQKDQNEFKDPAMTEQQRLFTSAHSGSLTAYKQLTVGDESLAYLLGFELYSLFFGPLPGLAGFGLRSLILPYLLERRTKGAKIGRGVTLRHPRKISLGTNCVLDDFVTLDIRDNSPNSAPFIHLGSNVTIGRFSSIVAKNAQISLGDGCNISSHCRIASESKITIGASVLIAAYCYVGPGNHRFDDPSRPVIEQGMAESRGVVIGDNAWLGTRATVLDGVTIGTNSIIGAHSLVTTDIPDNVIAAGVPAKVIRSR